MKIGVYIRGIRKKIHKSPEIVTKQARSVGLTFLPILIFWQEKDRDKKINSSNLTDYATALYEAGIDPWVWGYPWCGKEEAFIDRMQWARETAPIKGFILDPELGYQGHKVGVGRAESGAKRLVHGMLNIMTESTDICVTSFGAAHVHKTFPWEHMCAGEGSPQFYTSTAGQIETGLARWRSAGFRSLCPSVPAYGPNSGENLKPYTNQVEALAKVQDISITGWILWSWRQMGNVEWRTVQGLSRGEDV